MWRGRVIGLAPRERPKFNSAPCFQQQAGSLLAHHPVAQMRVNGRDDAGCPVESRCEVPRCLGGALLCFMPGRKCHHGRARRDEEQHAHKRRGRPGSPGHSGRGFGPGLRGIGLKPEFALSMLPRQRQALCFGLL